jgi:hypothetical protein
MSTLVPTRGSRDAPLRVEERGAVARLAVPLALLGLVGSIALMGWTWRHPDVLAPAELASVSDDAVVGEPLYFGMTFDRPATERRAVTLTALRPVVTTDSGDAVVDFLVCHRHPGTRWLVMERNLGRACARTTPAESAELVLGAEPRQQLVMVVELQQPGVVEIRGAEVSYDEGWQRGRQTIGQTVRVSAAR